MTKNKTTKSSKKTLVDNDCLNKTVKEKSKNSTKQKCSSGSKGHDDLNRSAKSSNETKPNERSSKSTKSSDQSSGGQQSSSKKSSSKKCNNSSNDKQNSHSKRSTNNEVDGVVEQNVACTKTTIDEKTLEFTKPTINQLERDDEWEKKMWRFKPLSKADTVDCKEYEDFNDEIVELNSAIQTLRISYGSVIKSLITENTRRTKKKCATLNMKKEVNFLTQMSEIDSSEKVALLTKATELENASSSEKFTLERFINPITRENTFQMLFEEVESLNRQTETFREQFFDSRGMFLKEQYDSQNEIVMKRKKLNELWKWVSLI